ncbi:hypothetical protein A1D22_05910 [Pasteurellaceae bacterium LFhippo2]|nr:hypothetical protein [Pasteurellaceae bacterium LFhippo2]
MNSKFIPNSFQVPNAVIDELMAELSGAELKCYLFVLRKTKGWNKDCDAISVSQFMSSCNLSNRAVIDACNRLVELGLLEQKTGLNRVKIFSVKSYEISSSEESSLVKKVHSSSEESSLSVVKKVHIQNNNTKNTIQTNNKKTTQKKSAIELLAEYGITEQLAEDFIAHRKAKRATITKTALDGFQREADKAGISVQQAVAISIERNWQGFKADWDWRGIPNNPGFANNPVNRTGCNAPNPFDNSGNWAKGRVIHVREDAL